MKPFSVFAALVALFALLFAPVAAFAAYPEVPAGDVEATTPQENPDGTFSTTVTVQVDDTVTSVTLVVTRAGGGEVYRATQTPTPIAGGEGAASAPTQGAKSASAGFFAGAMTAVVAPIVAEAVFDVTLPGEGVYTATATDQNGDFIGSTQIVAGDGSQGGGGNPDDGTTAGGGSSSDGTSSVGGGLPATGASTLLTVGIGAGLLLLLGGAGLVLNSRRRQTA